VEFLVAAGFSVWQTLPLGPTHADLSPYRCQSVHAGNELLVSLDRLVEEGLLARDGGPAPAETPAQYRRRRLAEAHRAQTARGHDGQRHACEEFTARHAHWLEDYALYQVLRARHGGRPWWEWSPEYRDRDPGALGRAHSEYAADLAQRRFEQFLFYRQWGDLRRFANERGVRVFGDIPLYVADDSADVWANRPVFRLDATGQPVVVAGVPPDYFSASGQRWGNPLYDWGHLEATGFAWWVERVRTQLEQFDLLRIDHFRGLEAYWEIPAHEATAINGHWVRAPGDALLGRLREQLGRLPLVAEDLGFITPEVEAMRERWDLPGMKVLQFAFGGAADNPYLPHAHSGNVVVYTGTHDNNTTLGWFRELDRGVQQHVQDYLGCSPEDLPTALCRWALASVARLAVLPMQDVLRLGGDQRMNAPGTDSGKNWRWRFTWDQLPGGTDRFYRHLVGLYGRG
jgi:4-alpha-glucanotransferase